MEIDIDRLLAAGYRQYKQAEPYKLLLQRIISPDHDHPQYSIDIFRWDWREFDRPEPFSWEVVIYIDDAMRQDQAVRVIWSVAEDETIQQIEGSAEWFVKAITQF